MEIRAERGSGAIGLVSVLDLSGVRVAQMADSGSGGGDDRPDRVNDMGERLIRSFLWREGARFTYSSTSAVSMKQGAYIE